MSSRLVFLVALLIGISISCDQPKRDLNPISLEGGFTLLDSTSTGITFNNEIVESESQNFMYNSQIYNGAGVAIGDINNDGLPDLYFGGNQVNDRLYLNKGNFLFQDITSSSNINAANGWTWGVTMADVNADGYLDIYVSRNGDSMNPEDRENKLFINNQDLTFTESAGTFGLNDQGFSTQAVFFDMDNDGDLDMYQVNQLPDPRIYRRTQLTSEAAKLYTDKLYENENGKFNDASKSSGLLNRLSHGLNVSASDFNNDGWIDLYVTNDYDEPDILYFNNGNGTFRNVTNFQLKHMSRFSMGSDAADVNNDGLIDLMTLDMSAEDHYRSKTNMGSMSTEYFNEMVRTGKHHQYMYNTLQINTGKNSFSDIAAMAGVASTDWSWSALLADLDNDGLKDIVVSNGIKKDMRNNDYVMSLQQKVEEGSEDFFSISNKAPSYPIANYLYKNKGDFTFEKVADQWGFDSPGFSTGMAYGDLDQDGDLDLVINNIDAPAFVYENQATGNFLKIELKGPKLNRNGIGVKAKILINGVQQVVENITTRGYLSSVEPGLFFGLGKETQVDLIEVFWPDGQKNVFKNVGANKTLIAKHAKTRNYEDEELRMPPMFKQEGNNGLGVSYKHEESTFEDFEKEILLPHKLSESGPFSLVSDVNGDGLDDLFIGGAAGQSAEMYLQNNDGTFNRALSEVWDRDRAFEDTGGLFFDADGDGDQDLYVASGSSEFKRGSSLLEDRLYINDGSGSFYRSTKALPGIFESSKTIRASDIDNDGDQDLFIGVRLLSDQYAHPATSYLLENKGGIFTKRDFSNSGLFNDLGMVTDAVFADIDNDNDEDLMVVGEWMEIELFINDQGRFVKSSKEWGLDNTRGIWWSISAGDIDRDGDTDFVVGNLGKNNKFKASAENPFKVYANDFDNNGVNDVVLAKKYKNKYVPVRGRECSSQQMPYISEKFADYHSFASSSLLEILPEDEISNAVSYAIESFESIILINENGKFSKKPLPQEAQVSPIKSSLIVDVNQDRIKDILLVGNHYGVEVETVRYDAGVGLLLLGRADGSFQSLSPIESNFFVPFDSRQMSLFSNAKDEQFVFVTNNNGRPSIFKILNSK